MMSAMHSLRLSAIIPNYNHAPFIGRAIEALLKQSTPPDEIIVVDDASTDNSIEVINAFISAKRGNIRLISLATNGGAIPALNRGLREARGEYIYFGSADDVTLPHLFHSMLNLLEAYPSAALACGETALTYASGKIVGHRPIARPSHTPRFFSPADTRRLIAHSDHWILTGASVYRRMMISELGGFNESLESFADGFVSKQLALGHGFCFVPDVVAMWRIDPKGYSRTTAADPNTSRILISKLREVIKADPAFPFGYADLYERRIRFAVCRLAIEATPRNFNLLQILGPSRKFDRLSLTIIKRVRPSILQHSVLLFWLTLHFRPTSLLSVLTTHLNRLCKTRNAISSKT
ncbi:MAG: glycosyltransferase [Parvibaculum sp.]|nr:glycosyltransferase [Parvibaculum sp.]